MLNDSWTDKASGADSWTDEASGAQCAAHTLRMVMAITGSTVDRGRHAGPVTTGMPALHQ
ncbi:hypothetical protein M9458_058225, partial [Cirrhinus mrigala]